MFFFLSFSIFLFSRSRWSNILGLLFLSFNFWLIDLFRCFIFFGNIFLFFFLSFNLLFSRSRLDDFFSLFFWLVDLFRCFAFFYDIFIFLFFNFLFRNLIFYFIHQESHNNATSFLTSTGWASVLVLAETSISPVFD